MNRRNVLFGIIALALVAAGLRDPAPRALQVWPDRSVGVTSGLLEGLSGYAFSQVLPLGFAHASNGDPVQGRTYLHFPLDVFPPGTEILSATLHAYVDSGSRAGEVTVGAYRVLEPWEETGWESNPAAWPTLASSPLITAPVYLDAVTSTMPVFIPLPLPSPAPTSQATNTPFPTAPRAPTTTPSRTPSPTARPTGTPTPTPTPTHTPTSTLTATPTTTVTSTPTATPTLTVTVTPTTSSYLLPTATPGDWAATMRQRGLSCLLRRPAAQPTTTPPNSPLTAPDWDNSPLPTSTPRLTSSPSPSPSPSPTSSPQSSPSPPSPTPTPSPASGPAIPLGRAAGDWFTWDVTGLMQDLLAGNVADYGLALAPAPLSDPEAAGDLLAARWFTAQDPETMPYLIVEIEVHPVTPTPMPILPPAGGVARWRVEGLLLVGAALLALSLTVRRKAG